VLRFQVRPAIHTGTGLEPDGARLRTRQMRPKKTIGRTPRQTPFAMLPHCGKRCLKAVSAPLAHAEDAC
jgi:hypothetical protein